MQPLPGLAALAARYDTFLVDQFGTLHDGGRAYPGAADALLRLRGAGKRVVLLSNSGKRAGANAARIARLGFGPDSHDLFLTSGELAWRLLATGALPATRGARSAHVLSRDGDLSLLEGLGLAHAPDAATADLVLIAGSEGERVALADYAERLRPAAARGVPALCLNPDRTMVLGGQLAFGAGRIAEEYEALGGEVVWIGKPHAPIYRAALEAVGATEDGAIGIGDSVEHDIAGASGIGAASALVREGIAAGLDEAAIAAECARVGAAPDYVLPAFAWDSASARA